MFLAGCVLLTFILLKGTFRRLGRRKKAPPPPLEHIPRPKSAWDGAQHDAQSIIDRQKVEMYDMARELSGQLNTKIMILEKLISDSQEQIDRMETLLERQQALSASQTEQTT